MTWADEGWVGAHWGSAGSGLLLTTGSRVLLLLRSEEVADPGVWGIPGGAIPRDRRTGERMDPLVSAHREAEEELGTVVPRYEVMGRLVNRAPDGFVYVTIIGRVTEAQADALDPPLNWESDDWLWATEEQLNRLDLHPGVAWVLSEAVDRVFDRRGSRAQGVDLDQIVRRVLNPGDWTASLDSTELAVATEKLKEAVVARPELGWRLLRMESEETLPIRVLGLVRAKKGAVAAYVAVYPPPPASPPTPALRAYRRVLGRLRPRVAERRMIRPSVPGGLWHGWRVWTAPIRLEDAREAGLVA